MERDKYHVVPGPNGRLCLTTSILMAWIAGLEGQQVIVGVGSKSCPVCMAQHDSFECWHGAVGNMA